MRKQKSCHSFFLSRWYLKTYQKKFFHDLTPALGSLQITSCLVALMANRREAQSPRPLCTGRIERRTPHGVVVLRKGKILTHIVAPSPIHSCLCYLLQHLGSWEIRDTQTKPSCLFPVEFRLPSLQVNRQEKAPLCSSLYQILHLVYFQLRKSLLCLMCFLWY